MTHPLTPAQLRVMQAINGCGIIPSNTTTPLVRRLTERGLIRSRCPGWCLTPLGREALEEAEITEACRNLTRQTATLI